MVKILVTKHWSVNKKWTVNCNTRSGAPDDGRKRPKHVELKNINKNTFAASGWF
jgi:hypothetical protein